MLPGSRFSLHVGDEEYPLKPGDNSVGRHPACDIVVVDTTVSRRHARLQVDGDRVLVVDLGSRNGVKINREPLREARPVGHGDRIWVGDVELELRDSTQPPPRQRKSTLPATPRTQQATPVAVPRRDEPTQPTVYEPLVASLEQAVAQQTPDALDRAERALRNWVKNERHTTVPPDPRVLRRLGRLATDVIRQTGRHGLLDGLFALCAATGHVLEHAVITDLEQLSTRDAEGLTKSSALWAYVSRLRSREAQLDDDARQRLDRLARLAGFGPS